MRLEGISISPMKVCAFSQMVRVTQVMAVTALSTGQEAWICFMCAMLLYVVTVNKNYFNCGNYILLGTIDSVRAIERAWLQVTKDPALWVNIVQVVLHLICSLCAFQAYKKLKAAHSHLFHDFPNSRRLTPQVPLLSNYTAISEDDFTPSR